MKVTQARQILNDMHGAADAELWIQNTNGEWVEVVDITTEYNCGVKWIAVRTAANSGD